MFSNQKKGFYMKKLIGLLPEISYVSISYVFNVFGMLTPFDTFKFTLGMVDGMGYHLLPH